MELATFWNQKHPLSEKAESLFDQLVPDMGKCDTIVGELLRASSKIGYDWYNNGWGCNNWSGAVIFLKEHHEELDLNAEEVSELNKQLDYVYEYSHGEPADHLKYNSRACEAVTKIHELIVTGILRSSPVDWSGNSLDMHDLAEEDYVPGEDDDDDLYASDDEEEEE